MTGPTILAHLAGRMMFHKIHMVAGDRVEVAMSHYDHSRELPPRLLTLVRKLDDGDWLLPNVSWQNDVDFTGRLKCQVRRQRAAGVLLPVTGPLHIIGIV
jgi:hypothetical protein